MITIGNHCHSATRPHLSATLEKLAALHSPASTEQGAADVTVAAPVLNVSGGGIFFFWKAGVLKYLMQHHDLSSLRLRGASAGALIVALAACEVDIDRAVERAHELAAEYGVYSRPLGLAGVWGGLVRQWLYDVLPEDAHTRCTGRVQMVVTVLPTLKPLLLDSFDSKADVIDACMASAHVPFFLDGKLSANIRGKRAIDGCASCLLSYLGQLASLPKLSIRRGSRRRHAQSTTRAAAAAAVAAAAGASSMPHLSSLSDLHGLMPYGHLLAGKSTQGRQGFLLDFSLDNALGLSRLAMLKLVTQEGVQLLMQRGMEYAQRMHAEGVWQDKLGLVPFT